MPSSKPPLNLIKCGKLLANLDTGRYSIEGNAVVCRTANGLRNAKCSRPYLILMICMMRYSVKMGQHFGNAGDRGLKQRAKVLKLNSVATLTILQLNLHAILVKLTKPIMNNRLKSCANSM